MARGWESKAVEAQQLERQGPRANGDAERHSPADAERARRRGTLELARARAAADLTRARNAAHTAMLERTIAALDQQLQALDEPAGT